MLVKVITMQFLM